MPSMKMLDGSRTLYLMCRGRQLKSLKGPSARRYRHLVGVSDFVTLSIRARTWHSKH